MVKGTVHDSHLYNAILRMQSLSFISKLKLFAVNRFLFSLNAFLVLVYSSTQYFTLLLLPSSVMLLSKYLVTQLYFPLFSQQYDDCSFSVCVLVFTLNFSFNTVSISLQISCRTRSLSTDSKSDHVHFS